MDGFNQELDAFIGRIERRAKEKTDKLMAEVGHAQKFESFIYSYFRPCSISMNRFAEYLL